MPAADYRSVVASLRRAKMLAVSGLLVVAAVFVPLVLAVSRDFVVPAVVLLAVWYYWFLPSHRRRLRRIYETLPRWEIASGSTADELTGGEAPAAGTTAPEPSTDRPQHGNRSPRRPSP